MNNLIYFQILRKHKNKLNDFSEERKTNKMRFSFSKCKTTEFRLRRERKSWKFICFSIYAKTPINHVWERLAPRAFMQTLLLWIRRQCALPLWHNKIFYQNSWHNCRVFIFERLYKLIEGFRRLAISIVVDFKVKWFGNSVKLFLVLCGNSRTNTQSLLLTSRRSKIHLHYQEFFYGSRVRRPRNSFATR